MDERIRELEAENAALRTSCENLAALYNESKASGKAARRLAKEAMRANGVVGAHVILKGSPKGLRLIICAPPAENEEALGATIARHLKALCGDLNAKPTAEHVGESAS